MSLFLVSPLWSSLTVKGPLSCSGELSVEVADWLVRGKEDFAWFGYSMHGVTVNGSTLLLVGSPTWQNVSR